MKITVFGFTALFIRLVASTAYAEDANGVGPIQLLAADAPVGFARAIEPIGFQFPKDHGPHREFKTEWWYYTGNLQSSDKREFGYQLTFFRNALTPQSAKRSSNLGTTQIYMAHFALTDVESVTHDSFERFSRGAAGLAGARGEPLYDVWLDDWSAAADESGTFRLRAVDNRMNPEHLVNLQLKETRSPLLHGFAGLSQKLPGFGNANYYYSLIGLQTEGTIQCNGETHKVTGLSWMDHEFGTSALSEGVIGWNWFGLQLEDGTALMLGWLRNADGTSGSIFHGTIAYADGRIRSVSPSEFSVETVDRWTSPASGITYPSGWDIEFINLNVYLEIRPLIPNQELSNSYTYWEGAVSVEAKIDGIRMKGRGYAELTGYDDESVLTWPHSSSQPVMN